MYLFQSKMTVLLAGLLFLVVNSKVISQPSLFSHEQYVSTDGDTLKYRRLQSDYDPDSKYPLVVFLHGSGERGDDNEAQLKWGVKNFASAEVMRMHPSLVIAPQCPEGQQWGNFNRKDMTLAPTPSKPMKLLIELIRQTIKNMPVDTSRIYITGLSMGGFGTFDAIARYPHLFAAAVPVCGGGDLTKAKTIAHIPIWIFHGALDRTVHPVFSQKMVEALTEAGGNPGYTQYPEAGHFSWIAAYSDPMMMEWLYSQKK